MSYKSSVLFDKPIAFYQSQNLVDGATKVIEDSSPCNNDAIYNGTIDRTVMPLIAGDEHAFKITNDNTISISLLNDYSSALAKGGIGTDKTSDNDFTLEAWIYPKISGSSEVPVIGDSSNQVGLFYSKGSLIFKVNNHEIAYTIPFLNKSLYAVCLYRNNSISIYIDGKLENFKILDSFTFSNTSLSLKSGPTASNDYFLINGLAVYRYALNENRMAVHFYEAQACPAIQVAGPDSGELFEIFDNGVSSKFKYQYPLNKSWSSFKTDKLFYDTSKNSLSILKLDTATAVTETLNDFIIIPLGFSMDSSKIEWDGDNGISVLTSIDGVNYQQCINGESIPQYKLGAFDSTGNLYIRVVFETSDASKYVPFLNGMSIIFYENQKINAVNSGSYIYSLKDDQVSNPEITMGNKKYNILSRDSRNGIKSQSGSGFNLYTDKYVKTLEFFYTPYSQSAGGFISSSSGIDYSASGYSWSGTGIVSKSNISAIYINGINRTSATNVFDYVKADQIHHVVIVFSDPISQKIVFNYLAGGSTKSLYQNIALYTSAFTEQKAIEHYTMYLKNNVLEINDSPSYLSITLTEEDISLYSGNWNVIQDY